MTTSPSTAAALLARVWGDLAGDPDAAAALAPVRDVPLAAHLAVGPLAWASVAVASLAGASLAGRHAVSPDPDRIAAAYASDRHLRIAGKTPDVWSPLSGFFRTSDGWVRTHGNYPHHAEALRRSLGLGAGAGQDAVAGALSGLTSSAAARVITRDGGLCVPVAREDPAVDEELRRLPLVSTRRACGPPARAGGSPRADAPLHGIRVVDLTRVIAGPVATRTLALLGADVLRVDPPWLAEPEWQHFDTGHGKRSTLLDLAALHDRERFDRLLETADVVVTGYRAHGLERLGLSPDALMERHPSLVVARLTAWGADSSSADRRGFDSLVQAASGIAWLESAGGERPGALPVQALDHSAGYLVAAGVVRALARRRVEGGGWIVETSLRRVAAELLGMPRTTQPRPVDRAVDETLHEQTFDVEGVQVQTSAPALAYDGGPTAFNPPRRWGRDPAAWC